jgi:arylsulfatase A-like enzyme
MRPRALIALGGIAGGLLAVAEVGWLAGVAPEALVHGGGALLMTSLLTPRAVIVGLGVGAAQAVLLAAAIALAARGGARDRWLAGLAAVLAGAAAGAAIVFGDHGRRVRAIVMNPFLAMPIMLGAGAVAHAGVLAAAWMHRRLTTARRCALAGAAALAGTAALFAADRTLFVRLYTPLHVALEIAALAGLQTVIACGARSLSQSSPRGAARRATVWLAVFGVASAAFEVNARGSAPHAAATNALRLNGALGRTLLAMTEARRTAPPAAPANAAPVSPVPSELPAVAPGANILIVTVDALRADHLGAYGYRRPTSPRLDALAEGAVTFERAYTSAPHTSFALASLFTGHPAMTLAELGLLAARPTLADLATANGYHTAGFFTPAVFFVDGHKFSQLDARSFGFQHARRDQLPEDVGAAQLTDQVLSHLDREAPQRFLIWAHYFGPHEPYVEHPDDGEPFGRTALDRYDGEIRATDRHIGRLIDGVRRRAPQTIVVVTADHGEEFGEHGGAYHGTTLFDEQTRVPLLLSVPGVGGRRVDLPVSTTSVLPTLLGLTGIPGATVFDGADLSPWLVGPAAGTSASGLPPVFMENAGQRAVLAGHEKLLCDNATDTCALFDLARDPAERADVALARPTRVEAMRGQLAGWVARLESQRGSRDPWETLASQSTPAEVRRAIARRMARLPEPRWTQRLRERWAAEADPVVRAWLAAAASRAGDEPARRALAAVVEGVREPDPELAAFAALAGDAANPAAARELGAALAGVADVNLRCALMRALVAHHPSEAGPILQREYEVIRSRICAAEALVRLRDPSTIPFMIERVAEEPYTTVQAALVRALGNLRDTRAIPVLRHLRGRTSEPELLAVVDAALATLEPDDDQGT